MGVLPAPTPGSALQSIQSTVVQLATPLLLFGADLKVVLRQTGRLLAMFLLGSAASVVGSVVAYGLLAGARPHPPPCAPSSFLFTAPKGTLRWFGKRARCFWSSLCPFRSHGSLETPAGPMGDVGVALGGVAADGWKVGAALLAKNVGGGINYIAVCETLNVSPSVVAAGLTIDNVGALAYFPLVSFLADKLPRCAPTLTTLTGASRGFFGMRAARAHIRNVQQRRYPSVHSQTHADGSISFSRVPRRETMASLTVEPHPAVCAESGG